MPLMIIRGDTAGYGYDAIVEAADPSSLTVPGTPEISGPHSAPYRYIIKAVWPAKGATDGELLRKSCRSALLLASDSGCGNIVFPVASEDETGYVPDGMIGIMSDEISGFLESSEMTVYISVPETASVRTDSGIYREISSYIDRRYSAPAPEKAPRFRKTRAGAPEMGFFVDACVPPVSAGSAKVSQKKNDPIQDALDSIDESFSEMLLRKIDEKGMTDAECYKKANIDRKLFSKIRSDRLYRPSKNTAIAFAIALELPIGETKDMLMKAGFALSRSSKADIIIEYCIEHGIYNIFEINEYLFSYDQSLLG